MEVVIIESRAYQELVSRIENIAAYVQRQTQADGEKDESRTDRLLTTREVITLLGVSSRTLQRLRNEDRIRYVTIRGSCRYPVSEIERISREGATSLHPSLQDKSYQHSALRTNNKCRRPNGNAR